VRRGSIARWALLMVVGGGAALGAMKVMKEAVTPQSQQVVAQEPAKASVVARSTQIDKIERALRGE
jgi:hypothetical protein